MKEVKITFLLVVLSGAMMAQSAKDIPLLEDESPSFIGESTQGRIYFPQDFENHWKLILSHPMDFTPVCTTEMSELAGMQDEFKELGVDIIVVSTHTLYSHLRWIDFKTKRDEQARQDLVDDSHISVLLHIALVCQQWCHG